MQIAEGRGASPYRSIAFVVCMLVHVAVVVVVFAKRELVFAAAVLLLIAEVEFVFLRECLGEFGKEALGLVDHLEGPSLGDAHILWARGRGGRMAAMAVRRWAVTWA